MKKTAITLLTLVAAVVLTTGCKKTLPGEFMGKWEIQSKDEVDEDGDSGIQRILELRDDNTFTETWTFYYDEEDEDGDEPYASVEVSGTYRSRDTEKGGTALEQVYDLETLKTVSDVEGMDDYDVERVFRERLEKENKEVEEHRKKGEVYGLQDISVYNGTLTWYGKDGKHKAERIIEL